MTKFILLLFVLAFVAFPCESQIRDNHDLRENIARSEKMANDTNRLNMLGNIAAYYFVHANDNNHGIDTALTYFQDTYKLSKQLHPASGHFTVERCMGYLGMTYLALNKKEQGTQFYLDAIKSLHAKRQDAAEARAWYKLGLYTTTYRNGDVPAVSNAFKTGIAAYKNAISIYHRTNSTKTEIQMRLELVNLYFQANHKDSGRYECREMIKTYENSNYPEIDEAYYILSSQNRYAGNLNISLTYILKGVTHMLKTNDTTKAEKLYGELAEVYQALGQAENSIIWYRKTIQLRENIPNTPQISIVRTVGFLVKELIKVGRPNEALNEIVTTEKKSPPENDFMKGTVAGIKASCYDALHKTQLAEKTYLDMMRLITPVFGYIYQSIAQLEITNFYVKNKKFDQAAFYLNDLRKRGGFPLAEQMELHLLCYKTDSARGNYQSSLTHLSAYKAMSDSVFSVTKNRQIAELQIIYKTEQKEKDISLLKKDGLLQRELVYHANNFRNLTFAGICLMALCMAFLYKNYREKQHNNKFLNKLVTEKEGLLEDKEWLIKEIHHRVKNNLQIVMSLLQQQAAYVDNEKALEAIQNSENRMQSISLIHQKLYQSDSLDLISMPEYMDEQISYLKSSFDLDKRIYFEKQVDAIELDVLQAVPLALIFNEAVTNAIKYAYPDNKIGTIRIHLHRTEQDRAVLKIIDHGVGITAGFNFGKIKSLGMNLMKGLSKQLGGKLEIENTNGVTINVTFKITKPVTPGRISSKEQ
ncbi:Two-component sensor histidine kinase, contains HisKA and HATPase domains [Mucilaginibacter pineti]|uniref:histidine kinase n=1 Tax=Mucilaginibacter pineti TaxID=1391627 RepID=A0A1G6ZKD6_9SPHI|nr:sensor histidine kinase [Mucilaginibacter pineti]SDE02036.1 Two-component sensor histidine kinase, contains HisKA and HATPase domains [Mucilaginibacter pineti]